MIIAIDHVAGGFSKSFTPRYYIVLDSDVLRYGI